MNHFPCNRSLPAGCRPAVGAQRPRLPKSLILCAWNLLCGLGAAALQTAQPGVPQPDGGHSGE